MPKRIDGNRQVREKMADRSENETTSWMSDEFLLVGAMGAVGWRLKKGSAI